MNELTNVTAIVSKKAALVPIIDDWIKLYKSKRNQATTKLVNFVLKVNNRFSS